MFHCRQCKPTPILMESQVKFVLLFDTNRFWNFTGKQDSVLLQNPHKQNTVALFWCEVWETLMGDGLWHWEQEWRV